MTGRTVTHAVAGETTKTVDSTYTHHPGSRVVDVATRLPNHATLTLASDRAFDADGHVTGVTTTGDDIASRTTTYGEYTEDRYPASVANALSQTTSFVYDLRFGEPKQVTDPDGNASSVEFDAFGRTGRETAPDGTVTATAYERCDVVTCPDVADAEEAVRITVTQTNGTTQTAPTRYAYVANAPLSATDPSGLVPVGGYVGRTGGVADYGALYGSVMNDLWGYAGRQGIPVYDLSGFDSIIAGGLDNNQLDDYLRTGRDPRIIIKGGELIFPEGGPDELSEYYTKIVTAGVGVDRNEFMDILEEYWNEGKRVAGYHNPSHGLPFDVVEAIDQKLFPSTDNLAEGLAREIIRAGWGVGSSGTARGRSRW